MFHSDNYRKLPNRASLPSAEKTARSRRRRRRRRLRIFRLMCALAVVKNFSSQAAPDLNFSVCTQGSTYRQTNRQQPTVASSVVKFKLSLSVNHSHRYLKLRLLFLRPRFPFIDDFAPEDPEVFFGIFLETHAARGDGNLRRLRRPPRVSTLAGERIERLGVSFDQSTIVNIIRVI